MIMLYLVIAEQHLSLLVEGEGLSRSVRPPTSEIGAASAYRQSPVVAAYYFL